MAINGYRRKSLQNSAAPGWPGMPAGWQGLAFRALGLECVCCASSEDADYGHGMIVVSVRPQLSDDRSRREAPMEEPLPRPSAAALAAAAAAAAAAPEQGDEPDLVDLDLDFARPLVGAIMSSASAVSYRSLRSGLSSLRSEPEVDHPSPRPSVSSRSMVDHPSPRSSRPSRSMVSAGVCSVRSTKSVRSNGHSVVCHAPDSVRAPHITSAVVSLRSANSQQSRQEEMALAVAQSRCRTPTPDSLDGSSEEAGFIGPSRQEMMRRAKTTGNSYWQQQRNEGDLESNISQDTIRRFHAEALRDTLDSTRHERQEQLRESSRPIHSPGHDQGPVERLDRARMVERSRSLQRSDRPPMLRRRKSPEMEDLMAQVGKLESARRKASWTRGRSRDGR